MKNILLAASLAAGACLAPRPGYGQAKEPDYRFSADIRDYLAHDTLPWRFQLAASYFSRIGAYQPTLATWDAQPGRTRSGAAPDSARLAALRAVDARRYLLERARQERIIIFNEAHHQPRHRAFVASVLPELAKLGYRYLAAEGVDQADSLLNRRGYPVLGSGYYTKEPQFGELLRQALHHGYRVVGYDVQANGKAREQGQARNIQRVLAADPNAKIVVYCGFGHISEGPMPPETGWEKAMAGWLKEWAGLDPFTVDQVQLTECSAPAFANSSYRALPAARTAAVFVDAQGQPFNQAWRNQTVDLNLYHPATTYRAGRPAWLFGEGRRPLPVAAAVTVPFPCLVYAYHAGEDPQTAVAADIVELQSAQDVTALVVTKGDYTVLVQSKAGPTQTLAVRGGALVPATVAKTRRR